MKKIYFNTETIVNDQKLLRDLFDSDSIYLRALSSISFSGEISLGSNISFAGECVLKSGCIVDDGSIVSNATFGINCHIRPYSLIYDMQAGSGNIFGPFCFIRDKTRVKNNSILGAYTEIVRSNISSNVKISHQSFIADADISDDAIIGAGVVFCNFNGTKKCTSVVEHNVTIGAGTLVISPVVIGNFSIVAAGSVVNKDIKPNKKFIQKRVSLEIQ